MLERLLLRLPVRSRLSYSLILAHRDSAVRLPLALSIRSYATPGRPKSVVGEPSRPVKRTVKKAKSQSNDGTSAAKKKVVAKPRKPAKKEMTPEQEALVKEKADIVAARAAAKMAKAAERKAADKQKLKVNDLKATALLDEPKRVVWPSAYGAFWSSFSKGKCFDGDTIITRTKEASLKWKEMSPADVEHWHDVQRTANEASEVEHKRWLLSHSANQIRLANLARQHLRRLFPKKKHSWPEVADERIPKRASGPWLFFSSFRQTSSEFSHIPMVERTKLLSKEWNAMGPSEKEKYIEIAKQDRQRYIKEHLQIYGHEPALKKTAAAKNPVAAAA